jgi:VWFA-related protein
MRHRSAAALLTLAILSATLLALPAQRTSGSAEPASPQDQTIRVGVPLVNLYATVLDKKKSIVPNLDQTDFKIFEDKVEQKIVFFSRERTLPLSIGLVIDTSGSEMAMIGFEQQAASQFFHRVLKGGDKAFVMAFDADAVLLSNWTSNLEALDRAVHLANLGVGGAGPASRAPGSRLYDTIYAICNKKMTAQTGRKTLIIVTDAHDEGSLVSIKDAVESAQRSDTLIHVLVVYSRKSGLDMVPMGPASSPLKDPAGLSPQFRFLDVAKQLAEETGGGAIEIASQNDLQKAFDEISDELHTEYSLGYYPTNSKTNGKYRHLKLEMTNKEYKAIAREGYYARNATK